MVTRLHATESLLLRRPQLSVCYEASTTHISSQNHSKLHQSQLLYQRLFHLGSSAISSHPRVTSIPKDYIPFRAICSPRLSIPLLKFPSMTTEMSTCNYTSPFSPTFVMCNTLQRGQLWTVVRFPTCDSHSLTPKIIAITIN